MTNLATIHGTLGFDECGKGGIPLVFLHGVGSDKSAWKPQLEHFGKGRRTIAFDHPGYGESSPAIPSSETAHDRFAQAILSGLDSLDIDRAHVCGLSLGGVVAIALAHMAPERVSSLALADTFLVHPDGAAIVARSQAASADMPALAQARVPILVAPGTDERLRANLVATMAKIDPAAFLLGSKAVWAANQVGRAPHIQVPTLVLCGSLDLVTPSALSREIAQTIPGAQFVMIDGAGHLSNLEKPAAFNAALTLFLAGQAE